MKILVVDDGQLAINSLIRILCRVAPDCDYISAMTTEDALTWLRQSPMDAAFLNLEMPGMNGMALARMIQKLQPRCNLIPVTEHAEYALEALQIFVSGFLLKPVNDAEVRTVLENLRYPPEDAPTGIKIQCFGNFEIFVNGRPLTFKRSKSKELLAYLVDRNGATCTNGEMLAVLWEDRPDTASLHSHLRNLIFDLSHTLEDAGARDLLLRGRSTLALDTSKVDCDYYNFLRGDRAAISAYRGEYMTQYSWAEVTRSALRQQMGGAAPAAAMPNAMPGMTTLPNGMPAVLPNTMPNAMPGMTGMPNMGTAAMGNGMNLPGGMTGALPNGMNTGMTQGMNTGMNQGLPSGTPLPGYYVPPKGNYGKR